MVHCKFYQYISLKEADVVDMVSYLLFLYRGGFSYESAMKLELDLVEKYLKKGIEINNKYNGSEE